MRKQLKTFILVISGIIGIEVETCMYCKRLIIRRLNN